MPDKNIIQGEKPAEVPAAGPADEPVAYSSMFQGFLVLPPNQMSSYANDPVTSFATRTAPADFNLPYNSCYLDTNYMQIFTPYL